MISVVTWLWDGPRGFRPEHVNTCRRMFARTFGAPHRFVCIADDARGLDPDIDFFLTPTEARKAGELQSPEGRRFPSCYRRLWMFSRAATELGGVVLLIDIDLVLLRPIADLCERAQDFIGWRPRAKWGTLDRVAGGMYLLRPGTRTCVWERFKGEASIAEARTAGYRGSDQAWISYQLGRRATVWPDDAGLYSIRDFANGRAPLPSDARVVQFNGPTKPWESSLPWVRAHWC